jgi:hypothetical protein
MAKELQQCLGKVVTVNMHHSGTQTVDSSNQTRNEETDGETRYI